MVEYTLKLKDGHSIRDISVKIKIKSVNLI